MANYSKKGLSVIMNNEKNIVREFNRSYFKENARSQSAIERFNNMPDIPDEKKNILYENITAPLFTKELEDELFSVMRILQEKQKDNINEDEFEYYIREFLIRFLFEMYSVNNHFYDVYNNTQNSPFANEKD